MSEVSVFKYLAVKNWEHYQPKDTKTLPWIRDYKDKDWDKDFSQLTVMQRYMMDAICRLRGRHGTNLPNDPKWIAGAVSVLRRERNNASKAIKKLIKANWLIETNDKHTTGGQLSDDCGATAIPLADNCRTTDVQLSSNCQEIDQSNQQLDPLGKERKGKERKEKDPISATPQLSPKEPKEPIEMDRYSAGNTLGMLIGLSGTKTNIETLMSAIDQGKRRWPDLKREEVAAKITDIWKEYIAQPTHIKQSLKNWLDAVGSYIDSQYWKIQKPEEFKPQIDWQGGYVGPDGIYVTKTGKRVPGYKCPPRPQTSGAGA